MPRTIENSFAPPESCDAQKTRFCRMAGTCYTASYFNQLRKVAAARTYDPNQVIDHQSIPPDAVSIEVKPSKDEILKALSTHHCTRPEAQQARRKLQS